MSTTATAKVDRTLEQMLGTVIAERYRIDRLLGVGGMGAVFRAHHLLLKRDVAIKVLHPKFNRNTQASERFEREAQSVARLEHPNIVSVTEFGSTSDGIKYLVMQLLEGCELHTLLGKPLPPRHAVEMALQILAGLEHAHQNGVVHRDLKPENVFVTRDHEGKAILKLVDFGVAKMLDADSENGADKNITRAGLIFGTPKYMSPEQAMGVPVDFRADLYSLGVILYEMLAGRPPLAHDDPVCLVRMQVSVDPPPLDEALPASLRTFVDQVLAKNRQDRLPDAKSARMALEAVLAELAPETPAGAALTEAAQQQWLHSSQSGVHLQSSTRGKVPTPSQSTNAREASGAPGTPLEVDTDPDDAYEYRPKRRQSPWLSLTLLGILVLAASAYLVRRDVIDKYIARVAQIVRDTPLEEPSAGRASAATLKANDPTDDELAQIDRSLLANNQDEAEQRIAKLRQRYPESPALLWRAGKAMSMSSKVKELGDALDLFGDALQRNPALLDDPVFYDELHTLLRNKKLRDQATEFAMKRMGARGHRFLLGLVNQPIDKPSVDYEERQRIYAALEKDPESAKLIDIRLRYHRDLVQSRVTSTPCATFRTALEAISSRPDPYFLNPLHTVKIPKERVVKNKDPVDLAICEALPPRLSAVQLDFEQRFGKGDGTIGLQPWADEDGEDDEGAHPGEVAVAPSGTPPSNQTQGAADNDNTGAPATNHPPAVEKSTPATSKPAATKRPSKRSRKSKSNRH